MDDANGGVLRDLALAEAKLGNEGAAALATAERFALEGRFRDADRNAARAAELLPEGSPGWRRARGIDYHERDRALNAKDSHDDAALASPCPRRRPPALSDGRPWPGLAGAERAAPPRRSATASARRSMPRSAATCSPTPTC